MFVHSRHNMTQVFTLFSMPGLNSLSSTLMSLTDSVYRIKDNEWTIRPVSLSIYLLHQLHNVAVSRLIAHSHSSSSTTVSRVDSIMNYISLHARYSWAQGNKCIVLPLHLWSLPGCWVRLCSKKRDTERKEDTESGKKPVHGVSLKNNLQAQLLR